MVVAFRSAPRILCAACHAKKTIKFRVDEEFAVDALAVIARTDGAEGHND